MASEVRGDDDQDFAGKLKEAAIIARIASTFGADVIYDLSILLNASSVAGIGS